MTIFKAGEGMNHTCKLLPICIVCEQVPSEGIKGGIVVTGNFLCFNCEEELTYLSQEDLKYKLFQEKLKRLWG